MGGDATSLRLLQLKDTFRRMVTVGTDCVDQQVRAVGWRGGWLNGSDRAALH